MRRTILRFWNIGRARERLEKKEKQRRSISDQWPPPSTLWRSSPSCVANLSGNEDASQVIWLYRNSGVLFNFFFFARQFYSTIDCMTWMIHSFYESFYSFDLSFKSCLYSRYEAPSYNGIHCSEIASEMGYTTLDGLCLWTMLTSGRVVSMRRSMLCWDAFTVNESYESSRWLYVQFARSYFYVEY